MRAHSLRTSKKMYPSFLGPNCVELEGHRLELVMTFQITIPASNINKRLEDSGKIQIIVV